MLLVPKRHLILVKFLAIFYICCALPANAGLLFQQSPLSFLAPVASGPEVIAVPLAIDDFTFTDDVELTELIFWTVEIPGFLSNLIDVKVMNGLAGIPDIAPTSVIFEMAAISPLKEDVTPTTAFGGTLFKHTLALPDINLMASTQYFLQVSANTNNAAPLGWQASAGGGFPPWADLGIGGGVQPGDPNTQMAFRFNGNVIPAQAVPEPQSIALFLFAFLLLSYRIRLR